MGQDFFGHAVYIIFVEPKRIALFFKQGFFLPFFWGGGRGRDKISDYRHMSLYSIFTQT